jgi:hypothetical protein
MKIVSFSLEQGNKYFGKIDGSRFQEIEKLVADGRFGPHRYSASQKDFVAA